MVTWDSKITTVLGMMGGVGSLTGMKMLRDHKFWEFKKLLDQELELKFPVVKGLQVDFALPEV